MFFNFDVHHLFNKIFISNKSWVSCGSFLALDRKFNVGWSEKARLFDHVTERHWTFGVPRSNFSCPGSLLFSLTQFLDIFSSCDVKRAAGLFVILWTAAYQAPLSMGILQARILKWVAMPFSRESSWLRNLIRVFLHCRWILYQLSYQGSPTALTLPLLIFTASKEKGAIVSPTL